LGDEVDIRRHEDWLVKPGKIVEALGMEEKPSTRYLVASMCMTFTFLYDQAS
jgi:hypothetical protein